MDCQVVNEWVVKRKLCASPIYQGIESIEPSPSQTYLSRTAEKNRLQNIMEDGNIKLTSVISDVFGKTGSLIVNALMEGVSDPSSEPFASWCKHQIV